MEDLVRTTREERKESATLDSLNGPVGIRNGVQVSNFAVDQNLVISYLNQIPVANGGTLFPSGPLRFKATRNGFCDPPLADLIRKFQQANGLGSDGVVDPGGSTMRALKASAARTHSNTPPKQNPQEQEFIGKAFILIGLLRLLVNKKPNMLTAAQLGQARLILADLEQIIAKSGAKPTSQQLPVQNNALAFQIVIIAIACAAAIIILSQFPPWRKAAQIMTDGIIEGITGRARRLSELLEESKEETVKKLAEGVVNINQRAYEIVKDGGACQSNFANFERKATQLTSDLYHRPALVPQSIRAFLDALMDLLRCLGADGAPLLELLQKGWRDGETLIDLLIKTMGGGTFILPLLRR